MSNPAVRSTDPQTSHDAADQAQKMAEVIKSRVWVLFVQHPEGMTDDDLEWEYFKRLVERRWDDCHIDTPRKRRSDLTKQGVLIDSGKPRRKKKTVWVLAPVGEGVTA